GVLVAHHREPLRRRQSALVEQPPGIGEPLFNKIFVDFVNHLARLFLFESRRFGFFRAGQNPLGFFPIEIFAAGRVNQFVPLPPHPHEKSARAFAAERKKHAGSIGQFVLPPPRLNEKFTRAFSAAREKHAGRHRHRRYNERGEQKHFHRDRRHFRFAASSNFFARITCPSSPASFALLP
ncbi:MAG: hypothetical protein MPK05_04940, partial [Gammaproteobacteria bacterium]|nr:hypothetical protein [Gammaproteobacteria bacterium]